jgi:hypothetical protein
MIAPSEGSNFFEQITTFILYLVWNVFISWGEGLVGVEKLALHPIPKNLWYWDGCIPKDLLLHLKTCTFSECRFQIGCQGLGGGLDTCQLCQGPHVTTRSDSYSKHWEDSNNATPTSGNWFVLPGVCGHTGPHTGESDTKKFEVRQEIFQNTASHPTRFMKLAIRALASVASSAQAKYFMSHKTQPHWA